MNQKEILQKGLELTMNPSIKIMWAGNRRRWRITATALVAALGSAVLMPAFPVAAQTGGAGAANMAPRAVLLFPAVMGGDEGGEANGTKTAAGGSMRLLQEAVTDALRKHLIRSGVSVTIYNKRLPSIQRAVAETSLPKAQAEEGLRDSTDNARAQKLADLVGATSYIIPTIDDYKYDAATRTATFNLSASHIATGAGGSLGVAAEPGKAEAPADVANSLQEGSASARAAEAAAERVVVGLFPRPVAPAEPVKKDDKRRGGRRA